MDFPRKMGNKVKIRKQKWNNLFWWNNHRNENGNGTAFSSGTDTKMDPEYGTFCCYHASMGGGGVKTALASLKVVGH